MDIISQKVKVVSTMKRLTKLYTFIVYCLSIIILTSCQSNIVYHQYQPVANTGWLKNDALIYQTKSHIPQGNYNLQIGIRHMATYIYRDIWLEISCYSPNYTYNDTLHLMLSDSKGNWFGKGIGGLIQHSIELPKDFIIKDSCCLPTFHITHLMKDSLLKGINDIGIQINEIP